jgi:hypothetical protein
MEPTTRIELVNLILTKDALYRLSYVGSLSTFDGAGNGTRTRDPQLGRLMLYQLSYSRKSCIWWRGEDSNLRRLRRQIYSLFPLTAREPLLNLELAMGLEPVTC